MLIDHKNHKLHLIDWGLAEFYKPGKEYGVRLANKEYKGPELLLGSNFNKTDYQVDSFACGNLLAAMLFDLKPDNMIFRGHRYPGTHNNGIVEDYDSLLAIVRFLGTDDLWAYINKFNIKLPKTYDDLILGKRFPK